MRWYIINNTINLNLNKPQSNEKVDIDILNENMDIIDECVHDIRDKIDAVEDIVGDGFETVTNEEIYALFN